MTWVKIGGTDAPDLAAKLEAAVRDRMSMGEYSRDNVAYVGKIDLSPTRSASLAVSQESLERLRKLCQLWDVDIRVFHITSHRKVIGPLIVGMKKLLLPILRLFMKEFITQQRAFNAEVISYLAYLSDTRGNAHAQASEAAKRNIGK